MHGADFARALDVDHGAAVAADDVVVVVADTRLEAGGAAGRLDATNQPSARERREHVVDSLRRDRADPLARRLRYRVGGFVVAGPHRGEHGKARPGDT